MIMNCGWILGKIAEAPPLWAQCVPRVSTVPAVMLAAALRNVRRRRELFAHFRVSFIVT